MKQLIAGIDTLEIGYEITGYRLDETEFQLLDDAKKQADDDKGNATYYLGGQEFALSYLTPKRYDYYLSNNDLQVSFKRSVDSGRVYPELHVKFLSNYLWQNGYEECSNRVTEWVNDWCVVAGVKVSRVDLCKDIEMPLPEINNRQFVTRALSKGHYETNSYLNGITNLGYTIGKGDVRFRVYDKTTEIGKSGKTWFYNIWQANGWLGSSVTRYEFQLRRDFLRQYGLNTVAQISDNMNEIWQRLTTDWIRIAELNPEDINRGRWYNTEYWDMVEQTGTFKQYNLVKEDSSIYNKKQLVSMVRGCLLTLNAHDENPVLIVKEIVEDKEYHNELATRRSKVAKLIMADSN